MAIAPGDFLKRAIPALLLIAFVASQARAEPATLDFGLVPTESGETLKDIWQPLLKDMSASIRIGVNPVIYEDYAGVVWAMSAGKIQIAWMGNKSAIEALDRAGGEIALKTVNEDGEEGYRSHLVVGIDSELRCEDDVLARAGEITFGDGDPNSTSGHVVPGFYLFARRGVEPKAVFKRVLQAHHQDNLFAVAERRVDVATSNSIALKRFKTLFPDKYKLIKVIWTSPLIPSDPIVLRKDMAPELKACVKAFFLGYGRPASGKSPERLMHEREVLAGMTYSGFVESSDRQSIPIRQLELFQMRGHTEDDLSHSPGQQEMRLKELEKKMRLFSTGQTDGAN